MIQPGRGACAAALALGLLQAGWRQEAASRPAETALDRYVRRPDPTTPGRSSGRFGARA